MGIAAWADHKQKADSKLTLPIEGSFSGYLIVTKSFYFCFGQIILQFENFSDLISRVVFDQICDRSTSKI